MSKSNEKNESGRTKPYGRQQRGGDTVTEATRGNITPPPPNPQATVFEQIRHKSIYCHGYAGKVLYIPRMEHSPVVFFVSFCDRLSYNTDTERHAS
jgi:hypothetical protein